MTKRSYRVSDWSKYNESLVQRGSISLWIDREVIKSWYAKKELSKKGRPYKYSDKAIECILTLKVLFRLTFRMTEGFVKSLVRDLLKVEIEVPDYTLLCKRQRELKIRLPRTNKGERLHLVIDTTGLKVYGEGEWKVRQHGWMKHRLWRKLHLAVNSKSQEIEAYDLTDLGVQDWDGMKLLLGEIKEEIAEAIGDGAYDKRQCYEEANKRQFRLIVPPQRNAKTTVERTNKIKKADKVKLLKRDEAIKGIRELGRAEWKKAQGYHKRSLAETAMYRMKGILGASLSTRIIAHQKLEVGIRCKILNTMTALGMPSAVAL
jgi:IS5 family transposase